MIMSIVMAPTWAGMLPQRWPPSTDRAEVHDDFDAMLKAIVSRAQAGDHILVMSNGGFQGIHSKLLEALLSSQNA